MKSSKLRCSAFSLFSALMIMMHASAAAMSSGVLADPLPQTIIFSLGTDANKTFGDDNFTLSATGGNSGNPILFSSSDPTVATIEGNEVTIVGAGTTTITASQAGNVDFAAANDVEQLLAVAKADQSIFFEDIEQKILGQDVNFTLGAFSSSGLTVDYTSSNSNVATVASGTAMILAPGETIITALQEGDNNYNPADPVAHHLIVVEGTGGGGGGEEQDQPQIILFSLGDNATKVYGDDSFELVASGGGSGNSVTFTSSNPDVATIEGSIVYIIGGGTATITASQLAGFGFLAALDVEQTLTVNKADQFITFGPMDPQTLGGEPVFSPNAYASSELPVEFTSSNTEVATVASGGLVLLTAGETTVTASQPGNNNYNAAEEISHVLIVQQGPQPQFITFSLGNDASKTFGDEPFNLSASGGDSGNPVEFTSTDTNVATINGNVVTIVGAGTTTIIASQGASNEYLQADDVGQELMVAKASQSIFFEDIEQKILGQDVNFTLGGFSSSGLTVEYTSSNSNVAAVANGIAMILAPGETIITALQEGDNNYNAADPVAHHLIVVPGDIGGGDNDQPQSINFTLGGDASKIFGDPPFELVAFGGGSGNPVTFASTNEEVATVNGGIVTIVGAGITSIVASQVGGSGFMPADVVEELLTVAKADQSITFEALDQKVVGVDGPFTPNASSSSGLLLQFLSSNTEVATVANDNVVVVTIVGSGETIITAIQDGNNNYNPAQPVSHPLIVIAGDGGGGGNGDDQTQFINFSLGNDASKTFGDSQFELSASGGGSGSLVTFSSTNTEVATVSGSTVSIVGAGTTSIIASQAGGSGYLPADNVEEVLTVAKADQSITFEALGQKVIGQDGPFSLNAFSNSGLFLEFTSTNGAVATVANGILMIGEPGETIITAFQSGDNNYNAAEPVSHHLIVVQGDGGGGGEGGGGTQEQLILFTLGNDAVRVFGDGSFQLVALGGLSGNAITFTSSNPEVAVIEGTALNIVGAGTATITASQAGSDNFFPATDVEQTLTVNQANQTITFDGLPDKTFGDAPFPLAATASSGLPINYHPSSSERVSVTDNVVTLVGAGRVAIAAEQDGNTNYIAANPVEISFCINPSKPSISLAGENTETPTLTSSSPAGNQWFKDGTAISAATGASFTASIEGIYTVQVTADDCVSSFSDSKNIIIMSAERNTDVEVRAYPNPVVDFLHIDGVGSDKQWSINDLLAKKISVPVESNGTSHRADVRGLNAGMYVLRISDGNAVRLIKFIKQ